MIAAAALATLQEITSSTLINEALEKEQLIRKHLKHPLITEIRGKGLMLAALTSSSEITNEVILKAQDQGLILFWLLFEPKAIRITPPLTISNEEITKGCKIIVDILSKIQASQSLPANKKCIITKYYFVSSNAFRHGMIYILLDITDFGRNRK